MNLSVIRLCLVTTYVKKDQFLLAHQRMMEDDSRIVHTEGHYKVF
jgi:hypothetical protein